jgi:hypothetical protein
MRFLFGAGMGGRDRNKICYCGSGLKYKKCHMLIKEKVFAQKYIEGKKLKLYELQKIFDETLYPEICMASELDDKCSNKIINAHTLTKSLSLEKIAKNGHVYSIYNKSIYDLDNNKGFTPFQKIGVRTASTIKGFCSYHDDKLFQSIEKKNFNLENEQLIALFYRTFALEFYKKRSSLENARRLFKPLLDSFNSINTYSGSEILTNNLKRAKLDYEDLSYLNEVIIGIIKQNNYSRIRCYSIKMNFKIPFVCSSMFGVYKNLDGSILQDIFDATVPRISMTALNIFYDKNGMSWILLNWIDIDEYETNKTIIKFIIRRTSKCYCKSNDALY